MPKEATPDGRSVTTRQRAGRPYRWSDGTPARDWAPASPVRRLGAWLLDLGLFVVTLGVGWSVWAWRIAAGSATPGRSLLGLAVFDSTKRTPATGRQRRRAANHLVLAVLIGISTFGLSWLYVVAGALGPGRRTVYDEWAGTIVLAGPRSSKPAVVR